MTNTLENIPKVDKGGQQHSASTGGQMSAHGKKGSVAAQRKRKEREFTEAIKMELDMVVSGMWPDRPAVKRSGLGRVRHTIDIEVLLQDTIQVVKQTMARAGMPIPDKAPHRSGNFGGRGVTMSQRKRKRALQGSAAAPAPAVEGGGLGSLHWSVARWAMLQSTTLGVMLLRVQDMVVVEESAALQVLCPGSPTRHFKGYAGQPLSVMTHWNCSQAIKDIQLNAQNGTLQAGLTSPCRLLRLCFEPETGVMLASWAKVRLQVSHVSEDGVSVMLLFSMDDKHTQPLRTNAAFWERYYGSEGSENFKSGLFTRATEEEAKSWYSSGLGGKKSASFFGNATSNAGKEMGRSAALPLSWITETNVQSIGANIRFLAESLKVVAAPQDSFMTAFEVAFEKQGRDWVVPCLVHRTNGERMPVCSPFQSGGNPTCMNMMPALVIDAESESEPGDLPCPGGALLEVFETNDQVELLNHITFCQQGVEVGGTFRNAEQFNIVFRRGPAPQPLLLKTFDLYESMPSFMLPWNCSLRCDYVTDT